MLKLMERTIKISSGSIVKKGKEDLEAAGFSLSINSMDPLGMGINSWVNDREEYNQNLAQCRADEDAFRAYARQIQDEMLAEVSSDGAEGVQDGAE